MEIKLRPFHLDDMENLAQSANNSNIARFMTDSFPHPYTLTNAKAFIEMATKDEPVHIFAIDIAGKACGGMGVHPMQDIHRKNAEIGYWIAEPYWGKGIVSALLPQLIEFAFKTYDINRLFAKAFGNNRASQRILEKNGFVLETTLKEVIYKNGEYLDELIYAIRRKKS